MPHQNSFLKIDDPDTLNLIDANVMISPVDIEVGKDFSFLWVNTTNLKDSKFDSFETAVSHKFAFPEKFILELQKRYQEARDNGKSTIISTRYNDDGSVVTVNFNLIPVIFQNQIAIIWIESARQSFADSISLPPVCMRYLSDCILILEKSGKIIFSNPEADRLLAIKKLATIGDILNRNIVFEKSYPKRKVIHENYMTDGFICELCLKENEELYFISKITASTHPRTGSTIFINVLTNITKQKTLQHKILEKSEKILEKNRLITSFLTHINQGICHILPGFKIEKYYSKFLEDIFGKNLENQNPLEIFFKESDLSPDDKDKLENILDSSLGQPNVNFLINSSHLPRSITLGDKILELDWQNIDHENITEKIMLVARDVTEWRKLEKQNQDQKDLMKIIEEIIAIPENDFLDFMTECQNTLNEIHKIDIEQKIDSLNIKEIYRNYHTLKGRARGYQLSHLVDALHQAENTISLAIKTNNQIDHKNFIDDFSAISDSIQRYSKIAEEKLGRKSKKNERAIAVETIEKILVFFQDIPESMRGPYKKEWKDLFEKVYFSAEKVFHDIFSVTPSLAQDLNKESPNVELLNPKFCFKEKTTTLLKNIFTHLLRNSLDHGLEHAQERIEKGKNPQGQLTLTFENHQDELTIRFGDDGKGLNIKKIKEIGIKKGIIDSNETNPKTIAALIFTSDFSTAAKVTTVSGRGVGMDAVRTYLEENGCQLNIRFRENYDLRSQLIPFDFEISLPSALYTKNPFD